LDKRFPKTLQPGAYRERSLKGGTRRDVAHACDRHIAANGPPTHGLIK